MKNAARSLIAASLGVLMVLPAYAGRYHDDDRFQSRLERQHERIEAGVESGKLTRKEVGMLHKQKRRIRSMARKFREDDVLSRKERRKLKKQLDRRSELIWELKHNHRERPADRYVSRDSCHDGKRHHRNSRYHQRDAYHEDNGIVYWLSDGDEWSRYGIFTR